MTTAPFQQAVRHFNTEDYREALLAFEEVWFGDRSDFLKALIQLCNALHQLRLGLVTAPRRTLATAHELLAPYVENSPYMGLDVAVLRAYIADVQACIPPDLASGAGSVAWATVPRLRLILQRT